MGHMLRKKEKQVKALRLFGQAQKRKMIHP